MLTNPNNLWYTDLFTIYRAVPVTNPDTKSTTFTRTAIVSNVPGRIYQSSNPATRMSQTRSTYTPKDMLACDPSVDIKPGDEIVVIRGAKLAGTDGREEKYFAGQATDYYEPFGGVIPGLRHKQVMLSTERGANEPIPTM